MVTTALSRAGFQAGLCLCPKHCVNCHLRATGAFTPVTNQELASIEAFRSSTSRVAAGQAIISEQCPTDKLFTLYAGWAFRYKTLSDGRRQILNFLLPGDFIGLQQEFADRPMHGIEALTDVSLCIFPRSGLLDVFRKTPGLGYSMTGLSVREESLVDDNLLTAGQRRAGERVAMLLLHLYRRMALIGLTKEGSIEFPVTQQHIADTLGLSLVHTNKTLSRLHKLGLHEIGHGRLKLLNTPALERIADYHDAPHKKMPLL